jgi:serine/threonine-protein kinase RsbW
LDWLIDTADHGTAPGRASSLLEDHLRRHAVDPDGVRPLVQGVRDELQDAARSADGHPLHLRLDWTSRRAVLAMTAIADAGALAGQDVPTDAPVPARHRAAVRDLATQPLATVELPVVRRAQHTFDSGPPPVLDSGLSPDKQGPAAVALALAAAIDAHPTATAPQAAAIAGALIASAGTSTNGPLDPRAAAEEFVRLHHALGAEAYVVSADDDRVELAVTKCPFGAADGPAAALCHVSSGLAGQLAAKVHGSSKVVLDEAIVKGDPECHLQVLLNPDADGDGEHHPEAETFFWPPRGSAPTDRVPHLDLSVALPRESVSVPVVRRLAGQALRAFGVDDDDVDDVMLAITEACANVIDHAGATDTYDVKIELSADRCAITVVDQGGGFDAAKVPATVSQDAEMGRGLALMRALVDNVAFRNEPQAGAVVHMVKNLNYDANHPMRRNGD